MKRFALQSTFVCLLFILSSCNQETTPHKGTFFSTDPLYLDFTEEAPIQKVKIESNTSWEIIAPKWLSVAQATGKGNAVVEITAAKNPKTTERKDAIRYKYSDNTTAQYSEIVGNAKQGPANPTLTLGETPPKVKANSGSFKIAYTSNGETMTIKGKPDWITLNYTQTPDSNKGEITVSYQENKTGYERTASISLYHKEVYQILKLTQEDIGVNFGSVFLSHNATDGTSSLSIDAKKRWSATASEDWISLKNTTGPTGKSTLYFSVTENKSFSRRYASIVITTEEQMSVIWKIEQQEKPKSTFTMSASSMIVHNAGTHFRNPIRKITINSSHPWIVSAPKRYRITPSSWIAGKSEVEIYILDWDNLPTREIIKFSSNNTDYDLEFIIYDMY